MSGTLTPIDTPGGGLTMTVTLPVGRHDPHPGRRRRPALLRALTHQPARPRTTTSHRRRRRHRAWPPAAAHPPDLVILDLGLPDMDGVEVIAGLRGWTHVPIIVLSARDATARQGRRPRRRRRRLRHQALRHGRTAGPHPRRACGEATPTETPPVGRPPTPSPSTWPPTGVTRRRRRGPAHPHRVAPAGDAGPQPRQARHPPATAARGLGTRLQHRDQLPARSTWPTCAANSKPDPPSPQHLLTEPGLGYRFQP